MGCPRWCSFHCWSMILVLISGIFLFIAMLSPWFFINMEIPDSNPILSGNMYYLVWWDGFKSSIDIKFSDLNLTELKEHNLTKWNQLNATEAQHIYNASASMSLLGFIIALLTFIFMSIFMYYGYRNNIDYYDIDIRSIKIKIIIIILISFIILFSFLSWVIFVSGWTHAINKSDACLHYDNSGFLLIAFEKMCSEFAGSDSVPIVKGHDLEVQWGPSAAWYFAFFGFLITLIATGLACCIRHSHTDEYNYIQHH